MTRLSAVALAALLSLPESGAAAQAPTDAEIAAIVVTANTVDVEAGKLAASRGSNAEVRAFGKQMVTDHTAVNESASKLAAKLNLTPRENPTSESLKAAGQKNLAKLKTLEGAAFDRAYIDHEVAYHQQVLDALDKTLIPNASNGDLKALLVKARRAFVAHLEHAKRVQASLSK